MSRREKLRVVELPPVQFLLYLVLRAVVMVIGMFPYRMAPGIARPLGRIIYFIDRKHARIAAKNLHRTRGICPPDAVPAFIVRIYQHLALSFIEMLMLPRLIACGTASHYVRLVKWDNMTRCLERGKGAILTIGHLGNWEISGVVAAMEGYILHSLARPIRNPWIDRYLVKFRSLSGQQVIPRDRALGEMIRVLQRNKILTVQVDQDARDGGIYVNFFGRPASTHRAPALLSLKYDAPIVLVNIYREGLVTYVEMSDPINHDAFRDRPDPVKALTQAYTDMLEGYIRRHPEQWFWIHDRWKTAERAARVSSEALV